MYCVVTAVNLIFYKFLVFVNDSELLLLIFKNREGIICALKAY